MKKYYILLALLIVSAVLFGQNAINRFYTNNRSFNQVNYEREYFHYCKADSNAVTVGFRYIISEGGSYACGWSMAYVVYNPKYRNDIEYSEHGDFTPNWLGFNEEDVWEWLMQDIEEQNRNCYSCGKFVREKYIRCEKITIPMKATLEGYLEWRLKKYGF